MHDIVRAQPVMLEMEDHFQRLKNIKDLKNSRYLGDKYKNSGRNMIIRVAVNAVNK